MTPGTMSKVIDGQKLVPYEKLRLSNIAANNAELEKLELSKIKLMNMNNRSLKKKTITSNVDDSDVAYVPEEDEVDCDSDYNEENCVANEDLPSQDFSSHKIKQLPTAKKRKLSALKTMDEYLTGESTHPSRAHSQLTTPSKAYSLKLNPIQAFQSQEVAASQAYSEPSNSSRQLQVAISESYSHSSNSSQLLQNCVSDEDLPGQDFSSHKFKQIQASKRTRILNAPKTMNEDLREQSMQPSQAHSQPTSPSEAYFQHSNSSQALYSQAIATSQACSQPSNFSHPPHSPWPHASAPKIVDCQLANLIQQHQIAGNRRRSRRTLEEISDCMTNEGQAQDCVPTNETDRTQVELVVQQTSADNGPRVALTNEVGNATGLAKKKTRGITKCINLTGISEEERKHITLNEHGEPVGEENAKHQSSYLETLACNAHLTPFTYLEWTDVPIKNKVDMWNMVNKKFVIDERGQSWVFYWKFVEKLQK
ncbi:uncharacterized protein LOC109824014 isoform X1 [Asparagus officinalis]|uniref:uncharacterized protein LOC109824014 isoform X1 n=2 Tax=Asparagus officinalis TaxID=4686 RepID=UPI00098E0271|nr:uncharacterized protein LOC109824014 isoform X1 [Asparagus officinalis]XP_020246102.1 uncharacterized protein LOC109824014 isoform X1 [Asparagus officinalis]XP_020246103.1 uncharacterized protein LOC109824014 isoform X1 [Asparagus officinalis]XP_020246104.1 uncharacterized protein LOC109824014 isoform X1 [Asparagus officinalis]